MKPKASALAAVSRETVGRTPEQVRRAGYIPAVLYGHGVNPLTLAVERRAFEKLLPTLSQSTLLSVVVDDRAEPRKVIVHELQRHPLTGLPIHLDLYQVNLAEKIRTSVPLVFTGEAAAVKDLGGTLVKGLADVDVEALPEQLPEHFIVDVSRLKTFADRIRVEDLVALEGVQVFADAGEIVALVTPPRTEEELKELETTVEEKAGDVKTEAEEKKAKEEAEKKEEAPAPLPPGEEGKAEKKTEGRGSKK